MTRVSRKRQAGVTLSSYALFLSAFVAVTLGAVDALEDRSSDFINSTGSQIGEPRPARDASNTLAAGTTTGGGGGSGGVSTPTPPINTNFPPGVFPLPAGMPTPVASGSGNFMGGVPAGADLGPNGPWDDDKQTFMFAEGVSVVPAGGLSFNGYFIPEGTTVCTYQYHYSSTVGSDAESDPGTFNMGGTILGVAHSGSGLQATSSYGTPDSNNTNGMNGDVYNPNNKDKVIISADQQSVTFESFTVKTGADNARVFVDCTPAPPPVIAQTTSQATLSNWAPDPGGQSVTATLNSTGAPSRAESATFNFTVPEDGNYDIFGNVGVGPDGGGDNSFWVDVYVDGVLVSTPSECGNCGAYQWALPTTPGAYPGVEIDDGTGGAGGVGVAPMNLTAGQVVEVVVSNRESGASLFGVELRGV